MFNSDFSKFFISFVYIAMCSSVNIFQEITGCFDKGVFLKMFTTFSLVNLPNTLYLHD
jgi:hypothetical protein